MGWDDETSWFAWAILGVGVGLIGVLYLLAAIEAYPHRDAEGFVLIPAGRPPVRHPWHFALGCPSILIALAGFLLWKAYRTLFR